jgi:hypothetical protein
MAQVIVDLPNLEVVILNSFLMFFVCLPEGTPQFDGFKLISQRTWRVDGQVDRLAP